MKKLNFGCGTRIAEGWTNIDFHSSNSRVLRVNLLAGFPFPANHFDVVYSSHVLEHFAFDEAAFLMREAFRDLKPGGVARIVIPDLENTAREYIRILDLPDSDTDKAQLYEWIKIELLDQLIRSVPGGAMAPFVQSITAKSDEGMLTYIRSRTESLGWVPNLDCSKSFVQKLGKTTPQQFSTKMVYWYLAVVKQLIPRHIRPMIVTNTSIGEKHRWMYDRYGLKHLMQSSGFLDVSFRRFNESVISGFAEDCLDSNIDGTAYKNVSLFGEARKAGD